ncbi:MAG TPA: hypothetical protein VM677_04195 [Actinokineospora sp.]|nr:hypothetical protein [Actinokineospora sp.]
MSQGSMSTQGLPPVHEAWLPREHSLYRPRHGALQRTALVCAAIFFCFPLVAKLLGVGPGIDENRQLKEFPSIGDGWGFLTAMPAWASDNLPLRGAAIRAEDAISRSVFGEPPSFAGPVVQVGPVSPSEEAPGGSDAPEQPTDGTPKVIEGRDGWLYYGIDISGKCTPSAPLADTLAGMLRLKQGVERSGRKFVLVIAPDKTTMVPDRLPDRFVGKDCAAAASETFWRESRTKLGAIDLRDALREESARLNAPVYFPQDTHWTFHGGLVMTRELAERMKPGVSDEWRVSDGPDWSGDADLPKVIGKSATNRAKELQLAPDGKVDRTNRVERDFTTTLEFDSFPVSGMVNTPTAMIGDSFCQFATPLLAAAFSNISITHARTLEQDPKRVAAKLAEGNTVVIEVVERDLARGSSPVASPPVIDAIIDALAARPIK